MNILAVDTSSKAASCALSVDGKLISEFYTNAGLTHSQTIMPMIQSMLSAAKFELSQVDVFAVAAGPGSYTGLRIGISAVKGMAMAMVKPCAAVSTLYCLAMNLQSVEGYIVPVLDARCEQVYTAVFKGDASFTRIHEDDAISLEELEARLSAIDGNKILLGDGAKLCMDRFPHINGLRIAPEQLLYQRASALCEAASQLIAQDGLVTADELVPLYLRLPQAERELSAKK